jgi:hypothetical protein
LRNFYFQIFFSNRDQHRAQLRPNAESRLIKVVEGLSTRRLVVWNLLRLTFFIPVVSCVKAFSRCRVVEKLVTGVTMVIL